MGGIIGAQVPVAGGKALAQQFRDDGGVSLAYFGDGTANEGAIHETANLAAMWDLPLIMLCENNEYNITQRVDEAVKAPSVASRAAGYRIPGDLVDGNDPIAVFEAVRDAAERARSGDGPTLIEAQTVRLDGHLTHDPRSTVPTARSPTGGPSVRSGASASGWLPRTSSRKRSSTK